MLPIVKHPTFQYEQSGTGKKISYRPMINDDYKSLVIANEMGDNAAIYLTVIAIVSACTKNAVNGDSPTHEIEEAFIQIYMKSIKNRVDIVYTCNHIVDRKTIVDEIDEEGNVKQVEMVTHNQPCGTKIDIVLPLEKVEVIFPEKYTDNKVIKVDDDVTINMRSPSSNYAVSVSAETDDTDGKNRDIEVTHSTVESIVSGTDVTPHDKIDFEEFSDWMRTLPLSVGVRMNEFITHPPMLQTVVNTICPVCGNTEKTTLRGLSNFFLF